MAHFTNKKESSPIASVEFTPVSQGNFTFFHVKPRQDKEAVKQWLTSSEMGQAIVAETVVGGETVFVTHGEKTKDQMLETMKTRGEELTSVAPTKKIDMWKWRGVMSMIGQPLQFLSGWNKKGDRDYSIIAFASLNMAANLVNMTFGAQKSDDQHRLSQVKNKLNDELGEEVSTLQELFRVDDKRAPLRKDPEGPKTSGQKFGDFMQRNSVTLGEIGLRYLGGISLVAPMTRWKGAAGVLSKEKSLAKAIAYVANPDKKTFTAGVGWLTGKTLAFFAKTPDPYNPEPKSTLDVIREKYLFKVSTLSEMAGASYLAADRFTNPKRKIILGKKEYQDYLGGIGGLLFAGAFAMRLSAPYGVKELNMEEVYAHATDTLAKTPPEKMPQLMADTAAYLTEHLKEKDVHFSEVYNQLMMDMYRYHHIALNNLATTPEQAAGQAVAASPTVEAAPDKTVAEKPLTEKLDLKRKSIRPEDISATVASGSFTDRATQSETPKVHGIGV
jgi:hypothetical protein